MMEDVTMGNAVVAQARNESIWNTEPAVAKGAIVGIIGGLGAVLVIGGYVTSDEVEALQEQAGIIVPAVFVIAGVVQGIWTRVSVWSPKTAARVAVENAQRGFAEARQGTAKPTPTLAPPP